MMDETPLASSSPVPSKIPVRSGRKAKNSRRSVSLLDVSAIDGNPDVSSHISESNETLASGYRDSGYVRSEASSLEEDDTKASKELVEELKFKDVLISELQESNRGLRMRCADAENKIWRLRIKCQSHCSCCQVKDNAPSPLDSAGEGKDETVSSANGKYDFLNHDLFQFKRNYQLSASSNDLSFFPGHDRLTNARDRLANSFSARGNTSQPASSKKPLSRSKSSGTIATQTPARHSVRRNDDQAAEKLFALKVQQWQREHVAKSFPADEMSNERRTSHSPRPADCSSDSLHSKSRAAYAPLPNRTPVHDPAEIVEGESEASLLSVISERDSSLEVEHRRVFNSGLDSPGATTTDSSFSQPFADITNQRSSAYGAKRQVPKASNSQHQSNSLLYISDQGFHADGLQRTTRRLLDYKVHPKLAGLTSELPEPSEPATINFDRFPPRERPCGHCKCSQPSPVIIVPTGCCSCCKMPHSPTPTPSEAHQGRTEAPETPKNENTSQLKLDASTDSSDLCPIFEKKSKTSSLAGKFNFSSTSEFGSKTEQEATCHCSSDRDCKCSPNCSGLTVHLAPRFDAKAEYKRTIEERMKKFALDARAETESLSFQPWTSPDSPEMSPLMKRLAESSHYVNQMAVAINRIATRFQRVTGTPNPVNPSP